MNITKPDNESRAKFFAKSILGASFTGCAAEFFTLPLDTAKVRLQLQQKSLELNSIPKYKGFVGTMGTIAKEEGIFSLWNGLSAGFQRQIVFAGLRIGLYVPIRNMIAGELKPGENPTLLTKILAAMMSGIIGISVANPTDVVKIRLQAQNRAADPSQIKYKGALDCYKKIIAADGIPGLWVGIFPNILRNSIINAAEIASYDQYKQMLLTYTNLRDAPPLHIMCGFCAGFTATCVGSPFDVIKTRMMNKAIHYNGIGDCVVKTLKQEGPLAFYNGFSANFMRIGTYNICCFLVIEQVKLFLWPHMRKQ